MVFTLLFPDFYPECRAILPGFRLDGGVVCLADALCNRQLQSPVPLPVWDGSAR